MAAQTDFADAKTLDAEQVVATEHVSLTRASFRRFIRHRLAVIGSIILLLVVFGAVLAEKWGAKRTTEDAIKSGAGAALGFLVSTFVKVGCAVAMIALYIVSAVNALPRLE